MKRHINILIIIALKFLPIAVYGQYEFYFSKNDSLEKYNFFYVDVYNKESESFATWGDGGWSRFQLEVSNGEFDNKGVVFFNREQVYANGNAVVLNLKSYTGEILLVDTVFIPQPKLIRLNYFNQPGFVGEYFPLQVACIFENDRIGNTSSNLDITWSLFTLTCRGDTVKQPNYFFIPYYVDSPEYLRVKAFFNADTTINHSLTIICRYSDTLTFSFKGKSGANGAPGKNGVELGTYYRNGRWGRDGKDGSDAKNINVVLIPLQSENDEMLKVLFIADTFHHTIFLDPKKGKINIDLTGGNGGRGGNGGNGANGNMQATSNRDAQGGDGGKGGDGGNGGYGGEMRVITNTAGQAYLNVINLDNNGGKGGLGGFGGAGGQTYVRQNAGFFEKKYWGKNGKEGAMGNVGLDGSSGLSPKLWLVDDAEIINLLLESETW